MAASNDVVGTLATTVYDRLRDDIMCGELAPDEKLRVEFLRARYGAGTSPIREALNRLSDMSGGKPMMLCLYVRDFGNAKPIPRELMQHHLDLAERLLHQQRITGLCICGTCVMDLDWESNRCLYEWLDRVGDTTI